MVLLGELSHLIAEFGGFATAFDLDLTSDRSEFVDVSWANFFLNGEQFKIELFLISLLQESDKEFARLENLGTQHCVEEALVILLALDELSRRLPLRFVRG